MKNLKCGNSKCGFILPGSKSSFVTTELEQMLCPVCGSPVVEFDNSHKYIDLGLSVKWATCNMGALVPEECGDYYAWGEITPKHLNNSITPLEHKLERDRSGLFLRQLLKKRDVAHVYWNGKWRIPTSSEFKELKNECYWSWTTQNGMNGYVITSKQPGFKQLFLPATRYGGDGYYWTNMLRSNKHYWTNSLRGDENAVVLGFNKGSIFIGKRYIEMACSIRPVSE